MADVQMMPVLPQAPSAGDPGPSRAHDAGAGDGFGQALTQAKTTAKEKSHNRGDSAAAAKAGASKDAPQKGPKAEKKEKAAEKSVPLLPSAPRTQKPADGGPSQIAKNAPSKVVDEAPRAPAENLTEAAPLQEGAAEQQMAAILALGEQAAAANIINNMESALPFLVEAPPEEGEVDAEAEEGSGETNIATDQRAPRAARAPKDMPAQQPIAEAPADEAPEKGRQATEGGPKAQQPVAEVPEKAQQAAAMDDAPKAAQPVAEASEKDQQPVGEAPEKTQQAAPVAEDVEIGVDIELAPELAQKLAEKPAKATAKNRDEGPSEKVEDKTGTQPTEQRPNVDKAARGQNRPQAGAREASSMTAEEAGKALALRSSEAADASSANEATKGHEASKVSNAPDAAVQRATGQKEAPIAPPIIIESALPKRDKPQAKPIDAEEDAEAHIAAKEGKEASAATQKTARGEGRRSNADADANAGESALQAKHRQPKPETEIKGHRETEAKAPNRGPSSGDNNKANEKDGHEDNGANADRPAHGPRGAGNETRARAGERARGNNNNNAARSAAKAATVAAAIPSSAARLVSEAAQTGRAMANGKYQPPLEDIKPDHKAPGQQAQAPSEKIEPAANDAPAADATAARGQAETARQGHDGHGHSAHGAADAKAASSSTVSVGHTAPFSGPAASGPAQPATPAVPVAPKPQLPPQAPMAQLDGSVRWLIRNNEKSAEIQLYPEHLGKVTVRLRIEGNEVHARVWASEASTLPMLKEHKAFLETSLKEQGLNLSSFDLQHGSAGQQARGEGQNKPQGQNYHFAAPMMESWNGNEFRQELPTQLTAQPADDGSIELYA